MITIRNAKANCRVGVCLDYFPEAVINCPGKSNLTEKGFVWLTVLQRCSPSWRGRHGSGSKRLAGHMADTLWKQRLNNK